MLTELKKVPFDVSESEAELSSGYLIEYSGFNFALFIIAEYASILFFVNIFVICFIGG
jgi:NADH-quinone oxidoreductase subunit H